MAAVIKEYDAKLDTKKRITLRGATTGYYHVTERGDGTIILSPRELVDPNEISEKTLQMVNEAIKNFKEGKVSEPLDLEELEKLLD
ncbi:MAG TPA: hypothetical protein VK040_02955 [Balneolaceae bacterium]|nr:hypothetical protein [Balneolaceae bacterium]